METESGNIVKFRGKARQGIAAALAGASLFAEVPEAALRRIARSMEERRYPRGTAIFRRNDPGESLHVILEGLVKLVASSGKGAGTILYILRPNDVFGELLFTEERRLFTAVAISDVRAASLSRRRLLGLLSSIPAVRLNFIRILSERLVRVEKGVSEFGHTWSYHRLAVILHRMCKDYGEKTAGGISIRLPLTHADLAGMIGTTRETVTNQLNRFRMLGLVSGRGRRLVVDGRRLEDFVRTGTGRPDEGDPAYGRTS